jgi:hypothetical protein
MGIEEKLPAGVLLSTVEGLAGYFRKASMWPATFGLACCAIEMMTTGGPRFDTARFGGVCQPPDFPQDSADGGGGVVKIKEFLYLFFTEQPVSSITQTGNYIPFLIHFFVSAGN